MKHLELNSFFIALHVISLGFLFYYFLVYVVTPECIEFSVFISARHRTWWMFKCLQYREIFYATDDRNQTVYCVFLRWLKSSALYRKFPNVWWWRFKPISQPNRILYFLYLSDWLTERERNAIINCLSSGGGEKKIIFT